MSLTLFPFLIIYFVFVFIFVALALFAIYHLARFVPVGSAAFFTTYIFLAVAIFIIFASWQELKIVNWGQIIFALTPGL